MKTWVLILGGCLLFAANGRAQSPAADGPVPLPATPSAHPSASPGQPVSFGDAPFLLVYVARYGDNAAPRIALGLEKPILKVSGFEKCVRVSRANTSFQNIAAQLTATDTKTLATAIKSMAAPDAVTLPKVILWFTTPDNQLLDFVTTDNDGVETNLVRNGVLEFNPANLPTIANYLSEKLHLR